MEKNLIPGFEANRKRNLRSRDLESLQEIFMKEQKDNNSKISVKIKKEDKKQDSKEKIENKVNYIKSDDNSKNIPDIIFSKVGKQKKKDIIVMDISIFNINDINKKHEFSQNNNNGTNNKDTIFKENVLIQKNIEKFDPKEMDKKTGLPKIFENDLKLRENKISSYNTSTSINKNLNDNENSLKINEKLNLKNNIFEKLNLNQIKDLEYKNIHEKNCDLINSMSKEDLFKNIEAIKSNIPKELLEKMKTGFFQKNLSQNLKQIEKEKLLESLKKEEEESNELEYEDEEEIQKEEVISKNKYIFDIKKNFIFDIEGNCKIISERDKEFSTVSENLDYINMRLESFDFEKKRFTFNELCNMIQSTSDNLILMGLKVIYNLLKNNFPKVFNKKEYKFEEGLTFNNEIIFYILNFFKEKTIVNMFFYLFEHRNINIRLHSIKSYNYFLNFFFDLMFKNLVINLFHNPLFPIIKSDILNISNQPYESKNNLLYFKKTFFSFDYFKSLFDKNFLSNFYLIKKALENHLAIIKLDKNKYINQLNNNKDNVLKNYADENLLVEYIDFLKLNLFFSDHFAIKFINSEFLDYLEEIIEIISIDSLIYKRFKSLLKKIYILITLNYFDNDFIDKKIMKLKSSIKKVNKGNELQIDNIIHIKIIKILFYFKCLREPFFNEEYKLFISIYDANCKSDILVLTKILKDNTLEDISSFYFSGDEKANKLNFELDIKNLIINKSSNYDFLNKLTLISLKIRFKIKLLKYCIKNQLDCNFYLFNKDDEINDFKKLNEIIFEKIEKFINFYLIDDQNVCINNLDLNQINILSIYLKQLIKMNFLIENNPKSSNYKVIFIKDSFFKNVERINYLLFDFVRKIKYQILSYEKMFNKRKFKKENIINELNNLNLNINKNEKENDSKESRTRFLSQLENIVEFFLDYLKLKTKSLEKEYDFENKKFFEFVSEIPNYINVFSECEYLKYTKYFEKTILLKYLHYRKLIKSNKPNAIISLIFQDIKIKNYEKVFERIFESLKIYLNSNEDLRKSIQCKKIFAIPENLMKDNIYFNEFNKTNKSKYLPINENIINKNFMLQIFTNIKLESELKLNFFFAYMITFYFMNDFQRVSINKNQDKIEKYFNVNNFNILLKTIINFSDKVYNNLAEILFNEFIKNFILNINDLALASNQEKKYDFYLFKDKIKKTYDNEIDFENFYLKFDDFYNDEIEQLNLYYKFFTLLILYFNSFDYKSYKDKLNQKKIIFNINSKEQLIIGKESDLMGTAVDKKLLNLNNLTNIITYKYNLLLEYSIYDNLKFLFNESDLQQNIPNKSELLIEYMLNNLCFSNYDLYENLILQFVKYFSFDKIKLISDGINNMDTVDLKNMQNNQIIELEKNPFSLLKENFKSKNLIFDFTLELLRIFNIIEIENYNNSNSIILLKCPIYIIIENFNKKEENKNHQNKICKLSSFGLIEEIKKNVNIIIKKNIYNFFTKNE